MTFAEPRSGHMNMGTLKSPGGYDPVSQGRSPSPRYMFKFEDISISSFRPKSVAQVANITSYWSNLTNSKRQPHNIGKNGVMGEVTRGPMILFRY